MAGAAGLALASEVVLGERELRRFHGFPSQEEGWTHYESETTRVAVSVAAQSEWIGP